MSAELVPGIGGLDSGGLCYGLYRQLYQHFFNAQERKSPDFPYGIEEGDDTSIRLHNTAYGFAEAIAGCITGDGSNDGGGVLSDYLLKGGGSMTGGLFADYGFGGGMDNHRVLEVFRELQAEDDGSVSGYDYGVRISGRLYLGGRSLYLGGMQALCCDPLSETVCIQARCIDFSDASLRLAGNLLVGESKEKGVYLSPDALFFHGQEVYYSGNANRGDRDWTMRDGTVEGSMSVKGSFFLRGRLSALEGAELGADGVALFCITKKSVSCFCDLSFAAGCGICLNGAMVLKGYGTQDVCLEGAGGDLFLGGEHTEQIRLVSNLTDTDGEHVLVSKYGAAYFPNSLRVRHDYGGDLLSSYRMDSQDEGIVIHQKLRFGRSTGPFFTGSEDSLLFVSSPADYPIRGDVRETGFKHILSNSLYAPQNRDSISFCICTSGDFVVSETPFEASGHVGISGSLTRLTDKGLFFTEDIYLRRITDGVECGGNAYFGGSLCSDRFSSGFAGSGWGIVGSGKTGNISATFDELTVRKRTRMYELEVECHRATNGTLWVTDFCSGDSVEQV